MGFKDILENQATPQELLKDLYTNPMHVQYSRDSVLRMIIFLFEQISLKKNELEGSGDE